MPPAFNLSQDQTLEFNLCLIHLSMNRRTHLELKRNVISSSFQTWAPSFFVLSFLEIPKNFLVILKSKPDTHAYRFVDQLLKNILLSSFATTGLSILRRFFFLSRAFLKNFSCRSQLPNLFLHFVKHRGDELWRIEMPSVKLISKIFSFLPHNLDKSNT